MIELKQRLAGSKAAYWQLKIATENLPIVHVSKDLNYIEKIKSEYETGVRAIPGAGPQTVNFGR